MAKRAKPGEIIAELREINVRLSQGRPQARRYNREGAAYSINTYALLRPETVSGLNRTC